MNNNRRNRLQKIIEKLEAIKEEVEDIGSEETEAFDNLPESIQESDRGEAMEEAAQNLEFAGGALEEVIDCINEAMG